MSAAGTTDAGPPTITRTKSLYRTNQKVALAKGMSTNSEAHRGNGRTAIANYDEHPRTMKGHMGSAVYICGRSWHFSAEDVFWPAIIAMFWHGLFLLLLFIFRNTFLAATDETDNTSVRNILYALAVTEILFLALDSLSLPIACRTKFFEPNSLMNLLLYARTFYAFAVALPLQIGLLVYINTNEAAEDALAEEKDAEIITYFILCQSIIMTVTSMVVIFLLRNSHGRVTTGCPRDGYVHCCFRQTWLCWGKCWGGPCAGRDKDRLGNIEEWEDAIKDIGAILDHVFSGLSGFVVSDLISGLVLARATQRLKTEKWAKMYYVSVENVPQGLLEDTQLDLDLTMPQDPWFHELPPINSEGEAKDPAAQAHRCIQPKFNKKQIKALTLGEYYYRYCYGTYGALVATASFEDPLAFCRFGNACQDKKRYEMLGVGPCRTSLTSFLRRSKTRLSNLLMCSMIDDLHRPVFYVVKDNLYKQIVISIRGSLEPADFATDGSACPYDMAEFGYPGVFAHYGMLIAARNIRKLVFEESENVRAFMANNPDWGITTVGHSLGAGASTLLGLILKKDMEAQGRHVQCFNWACPPAVSYHFALEEHLKSWQTNFSVGDDMVPRLSLRSVALMRLRMMRCFKDIPETQYKYYQWYAGARKDANKALGHDFNLEAHEHAMRRDWQRFLKFHDANYVPPKHDIPNRAVESEDGFVDLAVDVPEEPQARLPFHEYANAHKWSPWEKMAAPGRHFHMLKRRMPKSETHPHGICCRPVPEKCGPFLCKLKGCGCGPCKLQPRFKHTVYEAHPLTFQHVNMNSNMVMAHMPWAYWRAMNDLPRFKNAFDSDKDIADRRAERALPNVEDEKDPYGRV